MPERTPTALMAVSDPPATEPRSRRRRPVTHKALALLILLVGLGVSVTAGLARRDTVRQQNASSFRATARDVTAALVTGLKRDVDLLTTLRAILTLQPHLTNTAFQRWFVGVHANERQLAGFGTAFIARVPARRLGSFVKTIMDDPALGRLARGHYAVLPPGRRPSYCLIQVWERLTPAQLPGGLPMPLGLDFCAPQAGGASTAAMAAMRAEAASGQITAAPVVPQVASTGYFVLGAATYRAGLPLRTPAEREAALTGWISSSFDSVALLRAAQARHNGLAISLSQVTPDRSSHVVAHTAARIRGPRLTLVSHIDAGGPWTVQITGAASDFGSADTQALVIIAAGAAITVLVCLLFQALLRSREQALLLADRRGGELRHRALHDPLTELPNRVLAIDRGEQMLARARRERAPVAALAVGLDGFPRINASLGHAAASEVLRQVGQRLVSTVRESDTVAALGGDRFLILAETHSLDVAPELVAGRVLDVLRQPITSRDSLRTTVALTSSVGIATGDRVTAEDLLRDADVALRAAIDAGGDRYVVFAAEMQTAAHDRLALEMDLRRALPGDELFVVYQPTIDLRSGRTIGVEALLRWLHPERGVIGPDEFIPIAEATELIIAIGRWVLREACRQAAQWRRDGLDLSVAVNVSARQLERDALVEEVRDAVRDADLEPSALTLEITETALMRRPEAARRVLTALRRLGVRVAIDDFGTGYSSLAQLRELPADSLKIDRTFVAGLSGENGADALIRTLVQLGKTLQLAIVAEGIETDAQLEEVRRQRCDVGQGFLFSRPLPPDAVAAFARTDVERAAAR